MSLPKTFSLHVGATRLDVSISGAPYRDIDALVGTRLAAFIARDGDRGTESDGTAGGRRRGDGPAGTRQALEQGTERHIECHFEVADVEWLEPDGATHSTVPIATRDGERWHVAWPYYEGTITPERVELTLCRRAPALEHALRAAAFFTLPRGQLAFHAAALVWGGEALLVAGHPGAGKSTMACEGHADHVLSNEIALLELRPDGWFLLPSPFWGTGDVAHYAAPARLTGIAVLAQAPERNVWQRLGGAAAVAALMPHVAIQAAAQLEDGAILRDVAALTGAVPTTSLAWYRHSHPLDGLPWKP